MSYSKMELFGYFNPENIFRSQSLPNWKGFFLLHIAYAMWYTEFIKYKEADCDMEEQLKLFRVLDSETNALYGCFAGITEEEAVSEFVKIMSEHEIPLPPRFLVEEVK